MVGIGSVVASKFGGTTRNSESLETYDRAINSAFVEGKGSKVTRECILGDSKELCLMPTPPFGEVGGILYADSPRVCITAIETLKSTLKE